MNGLTLKPFQAFKKKEQQKMRTLRKKQELRKFMISLKARKKLLEKQVEKAVQTEINNANKFLVARKKELDNFQKKIHSTVKRKIRGKMYS